MIQKLLALSLFSIISIFTGLMAQEKGYRIEFEISDLPDTALVLAYYYGESTYTRDTARTDARGYAVFSGDERLPGGVFILVLSSTKSKLFDFAVYRDQHFKITTSLADYYRNAIITGDKDNELFFKNMIFNADQNVLAKPHSDIVNDSTLADAAREEAIAALKKINQQVTAFQESVILGDPGSLVAKILSARKKTEVPDPPKNEEGKVDSTFQYRYYKSNFWTSFDLTEDALIRLPFPLYQQKTDEFFDRVVVQHPDSVIKEIDGLIARAKPNTETYKFLTWSLVVKYYSHPVMGFDKVFIHLYDTYFESGDMDFWVDKGTKANLKDRADKLRLSLIGMDAPDLIMQDVNLNRTSMHALKNKYTVLYIYDPDCGHCKKETPRLVDFVSNTKLDVQVFSVCADTSMTKMKQYINEMGMGDWVNVNGPRTYVGSYQDLYDAFQTPTLYVLDEKKKIIAKKLPAENLSDFLEKYDKYKVIK
ncbi:MAG: thioredoxin-like domain-containing protein [Cyclobacteriaceae bacterium]|nr:thioredoxin-like domain-containing protein [Cyclobacteriaceae bacterium]